MDFVAHYLGRSGTTIDLGAVGLLSTFLGSPSVSSSMTNERVNMVGRAAAASKQACKNCSAGTKSGRFTAGDGNEYVNPYLDGTPLCRLADRKHDPECSSTCSWSADCSQRTFSVSCTSQWRLRDRFTNPFSQGEPGGNPGQPNDLLGVPYDIVADWTTRYYGGGSW